MRIIPRELLAIASPPLNIIRSKCSDAIRLVRSTIPQKRPSFYLLATLPILGALALYSKARLSAANSQTLQSTRNHEPASETLLSDNLETEGVDSGTSPNGTDTESSTSSSDIEFDISSNYLLSGNVLSHSSDTRSDEYAAHFSDCAASWLSSSVADSPLPPCIDRRRDSVGVCHGCRTAIRELKFMIEDDVKMLSKEADAWLLNYELPVQDAAGHSCSHTIRAKESDRDKESSLWNLLDSHVDQWLTKYSLPHQTDPNDRAP